MEVYGTSLFMMRIKGPIIALFLRKDTLNNDEIKRLSHSSYIFFLTYA
jgi:hypothetical protein